MMYILTDASLDKINRSFLFDTFSPMQAYVINLQEVLAVIPNGTVYPRGQCEFNVV